MPKQYPGQTNGSARAPSVYSKIPSKVMDRVELKEDVISKDEGAVSYAMAPVWILTTRYQNQPYTFMMNGQTGKMIGSLPYDKQKANLYWAGSSLILTVVFYFIAKLFV